MSPTQRTRKHLKDAGIESAIVERWNSFAKLRQDLFGFADLVALQDKITAIQVTSGSNVSKRVQKIFDTPAARSWLTSGGAIEVHGWRAKTKNKKRVGWVLRRLTVTLDGMGAMVAKEAA